MQLNVRLKTIAWIQTAQVCNQNLQKARIFILRKQENFWVLKDKTMHLIGLRSEVNFPKSFTFSLQAKENFQSIISIFK